MCPFEWMSPLFELPTRRSQPTAVGHTEALPWELDTNERIVDGLDMGAYDRECNPCVYSFGGGGGE